MPSTHAPVLGEGSSSHCPLTILAVDDMPRILIFATDPGAERAYGDLRTQR